MIETLFAPTFAIVQLERGTAVVVEQRTTVVAEQQRASAWYDLVRREL